MMCEDIRYLQDPSIPFNSGFCFLDASSNAGTMRKVLRFCCKRNFKKLLIIDPLRNGEYVVPINPIDYTKPSEANEGYLMDTVRVLWGTKDAMDEAIIRKYLPKVFRALHNGKYTIPDAECFTIPIKSQTEQILNQDGLHYPTKQTLWNALNRQTEWRDFQSTCRRLDPFFNRTMKEMYGSRVGVDFKELITKGWVILVNLHPGDVFSREHSKLLGTTLIVEIARALEQLTRHGYTVPFYLYIDEVGHYATRKLAEILDYYRHLNIRLTIAHQGFSQIEDRSVLEAIVRSAKNKVMFFTASHGDRYGMLQQMNYGGDLSVSQVTWVHGSIPTQEAVVRIGKQPPVLTRMKDWPDTIVPADELDRFVKSIFTSNLDLYRRKADVWKELETRFEVHTPQATQSVRRNNLASKAGGNPKVSKRRKGDDGAATRQGDTVLKGGEEDRTAPPERERPGDWANSQDIQISWDVPAYDSDARPPVQGREGEAQQGSKRKGRKG